MRRNHPVLPGFSDDVPPRVEQADLDARRARDDAWYDGLLAVLQQIGAPGRRKDLVVELDVQPSHLSEALSQSERAGGKQVQLRWLRTFVRLSTPELRQQLREQLDELFDDEPLTPEEELAQLREAVLAEYGPAGARVIKSAQRRQRPAAGKAGR